MLDPLTSGEFAVETPFAWEVLTDKRLYKFRAFGTELQKERLRDIVLGNRVRFSKLIDPARMLLNF